MKYYSKNYPETPNFRSQQFTDKLHLARVSNFSKKFRSTSSVVSHSSQAWKAAPSPAIRVTVEPSKATRLHKGKKHIKWPQSLDAATIGT